MINKSNVSSNTIAVIGAGVAGSVQALLLAKNGFNVVLFDVYPEPESKFINNLDQWQEVNPGLRMSAITLKSEQILQELGVWSQLNNRCGLMKKIYIWDENGPGDITFDSLSIGRNYMATIVENNLLLELITKELKKSNNIKIVRPCEIMKIENVNTKSRINDSDKNISFKSKPSKFKIITKDSYYNTDLVIGADGANSWVRNYFNFDCEIQSYEHTALVTNIYTEKPHNNVGNQLFLKEGPLAFLPWRDSNCCSIVWSQTEKSAKYWQSCEQQIFNQGLENKFNSKLGKILSSDKRVVFPLIKRHVAKYYKDGVVLLGDAAHTIHPMAGQGLNMGIYDAYELSGILALAKQKKYNISSDHILKQYNLKRRGYNQQLLDLMSFFKNRYADNRIDVNLLRGLGMSAINNLSFVKKKIIRYAAGL